MRTFLQDGDRAALLREELRELEADQSTSQDADPLALW